MAGNEIKGDMIRGHVDTFILLSLVDGDKDSNEIKVAIEDKSDNKFTVKQGTFYSAMQRLVKQNYIKEYRSSAADGIRRKYYSLTEKGKKSLDKNREEWNKSKELIDNLIETQEEPNVQSKSQIAPVEHDEFDTFKKLADINAKDYDFISPDDLSDDYTNKLGAEVLNELNSELKSTKFDDENTVFEDNVKQSFENTPTVLFDENSIYSNSELDNLLPPDENEINFDASDDENDLAKTEDIEEIKFEEESPLLSESSIVYDFELTEDETVEDQDYESDYLADGKFNDDENENCIEENDGISLTNDETDNGSFNIAEDNDIEENTLPDEKFEAESLKSQNLENDVTISINTEESSDNCAESSTTTQYTEVENNDKSKDDTLYVEDGNTTNRREYKLILGKLFPKQADDNKEPFKDQKNVSQRQIDFEEYSKNIDENDDFEDYSEYDETQEIKQNGFNEQTTTPYFGEKAVKDDKNVYTQTNEYDFTDLYKMAKTEGFKVRTSLSTNKYNGNGIFLNKLNFHSSALFYVLYLTELLILNFALSGVLNWSFTVKSIIAGVPLLLPLVTSILYIASPNKKVREITRFKDAISVFLIITFQLIIVDLCVALFFEVDFNNIKEVLSFIVIPFILIINVPLFPILKYLLLENGRYFDESES